MFTLFVLCIYTGDWLHSIFESLRNLLELARELHHIALTEEKQIDFIQSNNSKQLLSRIPTVERIIAYQQCEDLCNPIEFLEIFSEPMKFILESERVWPQYFNDNFNKF